MDRKRLEDIKYIGRQERGSNNTFIRNGVNKMSIVFVNEEIRQEIIYGLPSLRVRNHPSVLAINHPNGKDVVILKSRFEKVVTENLKLDDFETYNEIHDVNFDYSNLSGKFIILGDNFLLRSKRISDALNQL